MADEVEEKVLEVLLNRRHLFMVVISKSRSISELRAEIQNVARELFTELRGDISLLETKNGARLPLKYEVGKVLQSESSILAYTSDYKILTERKRKLPNLIQSGDKLCKAKRKRRKGSSTANGYDKNTHSSLQKCADRSVDNDHRVSEDDDKDDRDDLPRMAALPENTGDFEQSLSSEAESSKVNESNDMAVDQIKRKLCFSECSRVQKENDGTNTRPTNTIRQKYGKGKVPVSKKAKCAKKRIINADGKNKKEGSKRFKISHSDKDLEITTVNNANSEPKEISRTSGIRNDNTQQGERVKASDKVQSQVNVGSSQAEQEKAVEEMQSNVKHRRNRTAMSKDKPTTRATRNTAPEQAHPTRQGSTFIRDFLDDMRELQNESDCDGSSVKRQELEAARNSNRDGSSLPTPDRTSGNHGNSRDAILSASKFQSLFSFSEHCQGRRKEAIEKSASKVADWLYTNNVSPSVTRDSDTEDSGREAEFEASPKHVRGTATTSVRSDDDGNGDDSDEGVDSGGDTKATYPAQAAAVFSVREDASCQTKKIIKRNNSTLKTRIETDRMHYNNGLIDASHESEFREVIRIPCTPSSAGNIGVNRLSHKRLSVSSAQTCRVKINKLPFRRQDGKLKVILDSTAINLTPPHQHDDGDQSVDPNVTLPLKEREVDSASRLRSLRSSKTTNIVSENVHCEQSQVGKTMKTTLCGIERGTAESNEITKAGDTSSVNNKVHITAVQASCHDSEEGKKCLSPLSEVNCSSSSVTDKDSEVSHEGDVVHNKTTQVLGQRGVDKEENEETPHTMKETRKGADSKEGTVQCQSKQDSTNETTNESSPKKHVLISNEGLLSSKTDMYPSKIQYSVELSKEEHSASFANKVSDTKTENEVSVTDEDSSANSEGSNDNYLHYELTEHGGTSTNQILSVNMSVDTGCRDEEENNDSETMKRNRRKGERLSAETCMENTNGAEKTFGSKPKNDRKPGQGNSNCKDLKGKNLAETTSHDPDEEEKNRKRLKSPKKIKSRNTRRNNVEHSQSVNHITSVASQQEEQNEPAKNVDGIPQKDVSSHRDHLRDNCRLESGRSTVGSVHRSESGKRERKNSNTLVAMKEDGLNKKTKLTDVTSEDLMEKDKLGSPTKRKVKEGSLVKHKDCKGQFKEREQRRVGDQLESKPVSDEASSETDEVIEEINSNCSSPIHLTPFKEGKQVVWMRERPRKKRESEQGGLGMTHSTPACPTDKTGKRQETSVERNQARMKANERKGRNGAAYTESLDGCPISASSKKKAGKKHKKEISSVQEVTKVSKPLDSRRKASKALLSLLDFGQGDSTEHRNNTTVNHKSPTSPRKTVQQLMRQFRQTPKGFCHTVKSRKLSASTSSVHIRRKMRKTPRENRQPKDMSTEEKEMAANTIGFEQLLEDDSLWDTRPGEYINAIQARK